ncbi:secondary thiamine-phosphate synthase enzyme YjbQ [Mariniblastus sp.]|jgi:secondary thiamine-phosphate synthase enzyme|nr:secondary thiamine-phosphate synthase enzyme YjbQ [Mariniblastus sp.]MDB4756487.1 secondary thiamine-phosphate synthase enzyme YjbQ [Mariniblastus sp.]
MVFQKKLLLKTTQNGDMCDITAKVAQIVTESGIDTGIVNVFNVGSTAAIGAIEFEPGLVHDLPATMNELIPAKEDYEHQQRWNDGNGHSHLQSTLMGPDFSAPIAEGKLALGTWQQICHLECDVKPRIREIIVTVYGHKSQE